MSMAVYEPDTTNGARSWVSLMAPAAELATAVAGTDFVPKGLRNNPAAIAACIMYGDEVGLGPMMSLSRIALVDGTPTLYAEAMRSLILSDGHELWVEEATVSKVTLAGRRRDSQQITRVTWTLDDARRANLAGRQNWRMYPRQMLTARATAELARMIFADVIGGLMAVEELEERDSGAPADGTRPPVDPPAPSSRKRRRPPTAVAASPQPEPEPEPEVGPPLPGEPGYDTSSEDAPKRLRATTNRLHAIAREHGIDRDERLRWASAVLGRKVTSFNELDQADADAVAEAFTNTAEPEPDLSDPAEHDVSPPLTPSEFRTVVELAQIDRDVVADAGADLFPQMSLDRLSDEQRGELFDAAKTRADR